MKSGSIQIFFVVLATYTLQADGKLPAKYWLEKYSMEVNIEGGMFKETYRSTELCNKLPDRYGSNATRTFSTHIYYLLQHEEMSIFHGLKSDELWHHYYGDTLSLYVIDHVTGDLKVHHLGRATKNFMVAVKQGDWYAAKLRSSQPGKYCLLGITVAPGFEIADYMEPSVEEMLKKYPQHKKRILSLTRP